MNTSNGDEASQTPRYITHTTPLPCRMCGTPTTNSRVDERDDGDLFLVPVCPRHRPADTDGGLTS